MSNTTKFLSLNFNLPDHNKELRSAEQLIADLTLKVNTIKQDNSINNFLHNSYYEETVKLLDWVGRMSMHLFDIEDQMEAMYTKQYIHSPALAKELFNLHYEQIHHPYTLLKNRCFSILDELDIMYEDKFKKYPPNWNI
jgi:hypothetical protein